MQLKKVIGWLILLGIIGWIAYSIFLGRVSLPKLESPTGKAIYVPAAGTNAPILKYPECMDTDKGKNYFEKGETYNIRENKIFRDYCNNGNIVEYFCNSQIPDRIIIPCDCSDGVCTLK